MTEENQAMLKEGYSRNEMRIFLVGYLKVLQAVALLLDSQNDTCGLGIFLTGQDGKELERNNNLSDIANCSFNAVECLHGDCESLVMLPLEKIANLPDTERCYYHWRCLSIWYVARETMCLTDVVDMLTVLIDNWLQNWQPEDYLICHK